MFCTVFTGRHSYKLEEAGKKRRKIKFWSIPPPPPPFFFSFFFFFFCCSCNVFSARHRIGKDWVKLAKANVCHIKYLTFSTVVSLQRKREKGKGWDTQGYEERQNVCRIKYQMFVCRIKKPNACSSCPYSKTEKRKGWDFTQNTQKNKTCVT